MLEMMPQIVKRFVILSIYISYYLYVFHNIWFCNLWRLGCYYACVIMVTFCCVACYM
jgi:hypothetical protein